MRKKCTNSSCRRSFPVIPGNRVKCPHCGKTYPRITVPNEEQYRWSVILDFFWPEDEFLIVRAISRHTGRKPEDVKQLISTDASVAVATGLYGEDARSLWYELVRNDAEAQLVQGKYPEQRQD